MQYPLPGSEVLFQAHRPRRRQSGRQVKQVAAVSAAESVHRLRVVADDSQAHAAGAEKSDDVDLDLVDVLVLVYQDVVPAGRYRRAEPCIGQQRTQTEQQIVEVEQTLGAFAIDVCPEQPQDRVRVGITPWKERGDDGAGRLRGVDRAGVDVEESVAAGKPLPGPGQAVFLAQ